MGKVDSYVAMVNKRAAKVQLLLVRFEPICAGFIAGVEKP